MADPTEPVITLRSECLLSKWGFNDGDAPEAWLDWCEDHGIDYNAVAYPLVELVRRHLLPKVEQRVTVVEIQTIHNPIRATTVDGIGVTKQWHESDTGVTLTPEYVEVLMSEVLRLAQTPPEPAADTTEPRASRRW